MRDSSFSIASDALNDSNSIVGCLASDMVVEMGV